VPKVSDSEILKHLVDTANELVLSACHYNTYSLNIFC